MISRLTCRLAAPGRRGGRLLQRAADLYCVGASRIGATDVAHRFNFSALTYNCGRPS